MRKTFNEHIVKIEHHNVAYNPETNVLTLGPTSKVKYGSEFVISVSLHKWINLEGSNKGSYIAVLRLGNDDITEQRERLQRFQARFHESGPELFDMIETGTLPEFVNVYKYSVNVWRSVEMKKTKWAYNDVVKPTKDEPASIQRLLVA